MNRNNTERRAAKECREAVATIGQQKGKKSGTREEVREHYWARSMLRLWRLAYPHGIPGEGEFSDGVPHPDEL